MTPDPKRCIFFYGNDFRYLSNFYPCKFKTTHECIDKPNNEYLYPTAEHAIMHIKACLMGDLEVADKILSANKPLDAKRLGRQVEPWNEEKWTRHVDAVAHAVLFAKFSQNEVLARKLKDTGDKILAEAAPHDKIWGIGIGSASATKGREWQGHNLLGKTLMKVRALL